MPKRKRGLKFQEAEAEAEAEAGVGWPAPAPMTSAQVLRQAELEGLKLLVGKSKTGFYAVNHDGRSEALPYRLNYRPPGCGITTFLGSFATAEEAALCFARTPEGQSAARAAEVAAAVPLSTSEEAVQRLQARKLLCPRVHELLKRSGLASQAALCAELNKMAQPEADAITKSALSNWLSGGRGNGRAVTEQLDASCQAWVDAHEAMEAAAGGAEAMQAARAAKEAAAKEVAKAEKIAAKAEEAAANEHQREQQREQKREAAELRAEQRAEPTPWERAGNSGAWACDRSINLEADAEIAEVHNEAFPLGSTATAGWELVSPLPTIGNRYPFLPDTEWFAKPALVPGLIVGHHNISNFSEKMKELESAHPMPEAEPGYETYTDRFVQHFTRKDQLGSSGSALLSEIQQRRDRSAAVACTEVKRTRYTLGYGALHSDGTGQSTITLCKQILKDTGGSLVTCSPEGVWRFVSFDSSQYVLLSTLQGAHLHGAAHLVPFGPPRADGTTAFKAVHNVVTSLILNIGRKDRAETGSFADAAQAFAEDR